MSSRHPLFASGLLAMAFLWGLSQAVPRGLAGGADHLVHAFLENPPQDDARGWRSAHHFHMAALTFGATMPNVATDGSLLFRRGAQLPGGDRQDRLAVALAFQRMAVRSRPAWPYGWQELLRTKAEMGAWDAELDLAFDQTLRLGKAEPLLQEALSRFAFGHWRLLAVERREAVLGLVRVALASHPEGILRAAQDTASELVLCSRLSDVERVRDYCRDQGLD